MSVAERHPLSFLGLGDSLAEARLAQGLDLRDVERDTRIRAKYLSALEEERFEELPDDAYVRVFLRTYASYLGLDADAFADEYRRRRGTGDNPVVPTPTAPAARRARLPIVLAAGGLAAATAAALGLTLGLRADERPVPPTAPTASAPAAASPEPAATSVAVTATRGATPMTVRFRGPKGQKVWQGTLREGRTMRLGLSRPLWIRIGKPENVAVRVGDETLGARHELLLGAPQG